MFSLLGNIQGLDGHHVCSSRFQKGTVHGHKHSYPPAKMVELCLYHVFHFVIAWFFICWCCCGKLKDAGANPRKSICLVALLRAGKLLIA